MITFWGFVLGFPLLAFGGALALCPAFSAAAVARFERSRVAAAVLTAVGWFWTAYECDTVGIDVFDTLLFKQWSHGFFVWGLAAVLVGLTVAWMPKNLSVRALTGILMLIPAELFKTTRLLLPESGFASVHVFVVTAYVGCVIGMYGMFYPWRIEKALEFVLQRPGLARLVGAVCAADGLALAVIGCSL